MFSLRPLTKNPGLISIVPSDHGLAIADIDNRGERPRLNICEFFPWPEQESHDKAVAEKIRELGVKNRPCATVMQLNDYNIFSIEAPDVPQEELRSAIRWQMKDLIDFDIEEALVDVFPAPSANDPKRHRNVYVVVSRVNTVRERAELFHEADANLTVIDIPELVLRNIAALLPENTTGVALIYLTADRGVVLITRNSELYFARTMDLGYENLSQQSVDNGGLSLVGNQGFDHLVLEIQRSLDYYDRYSSQPPIGGIVLAPMETPISGLTEYINESLDLPVRQMDLNETMDIEDNLTPERQSQCLIAVAAALRNG